ncbi:hypothetical protein JXD20_04190 [Candidatus Peregrinibacteria bacterium]|nr:hypothetical protein [Candidatus Peregrinibacteria bacterium]
MLLTVPLLFPLFLAGCKLLDQSETVTPIVPIDEQPPVSEEPWLLEEEARQVAESECIKEDESIGPGYYNEYSKTWWFDANLKEEHEGCNPACVVFSDGSWEVNWRCTGLIPEEEAEEVIE